MGRGGGRAQVVVWKQRHWVMTEQCLYLGKTGAVQTGQEASEEEEVGL